MRITTLLCFFVFVASIACDTSDACEVGQPLLDESLVSPSTGKFHSLGECLPLTFDISDATREKDSLTVAWLLDHQAGTTDPPAPPDSLGRLSFVLDPCTNAKAIAGQVIALEAIILSPAMSLADQGNADAIKAASLADAFESATVRWFIGVENCACRL